MFLKTQSAYRVVFCFQMCLYRIIKKFSHVLYSSKDDRSFKFCLSVSSVFKNSNSTQTSTSVKFPAKYFLSFFFQICVRPLQVFALGTNCSGCLGLGDLQSTIEPRRIDVLCGKKIVSLSYGTGPHLAIATAGDPLWTPFCFLAEGKFPLETQGQHPPAVEQNRHSSTGKLQDDLKAQLFIFRTLLTKNLKNKLKTKLLFCQISF